MLQKHHASAPRRAAPRFSTTLQHHAPAQQQCFRTNLQHHGSTPRRSAERPSAPRLNTMLQNTPSTSRRSAPCSSITVQRRAAETPFRDHASDHEAQHHASVPHSSTMLPNRLSTTFQDHVLAPHISTMLQEHPFSTTVQQPKVQHNASAPRPSAPCFRTML